MKVRTAVQEDVESILSLALEFGDFLVKLYSNQERSQDTVKQRNFKDKVKNFVSGLIDAKNVLFLVATMDDKIVGGLVAKVEEKVSPYYETTKLGKVEYMFVSPKFQGKGAGAHLIDEAESWFKLQKVQVINIDVLANNASALSFYSKAGYKEFNLILGKNLK